MAETCLEDSGRLMKLRCGFGYPFFSEAGDVSQKRPHSQFIWPLMVSVSRAF